RPTARPRSRGAAAYFGWRGQWQPGQNAPRRRGGGRRRMVRHRAVAAASAGILLLTAGCGARTDQTEAARTGTIRSYAETPGGGGALRGTRVVLVRKNADGGDQVVE